MRIRRLRLTSMRAFEQAEFDFTPGMNLLVGVNGVGKSTVLDALSICLSRILPQVTPSRSSPRSFALEDIRGDSPSLTAALVLQVGKQEFQYLRHQQRESTLAPASDEIVSEERARLEQRPARRGALRKRLRRLQETPTAPHLDMYTPELQALQAAVKAARRTPIAVYFSTRRSLVSDASPTLGRTLRGPAVAFANALNNRELLLADFAFWMHAQARLARENPRARKHLTALLLAARGFLPDCKYLSAETSPKPRLLVEKDGMTLDVRQLSDGERGLLALVLDLARRLSQANPDLPNPVRQGEAIVLIDELDLHLHPKWQRTIVGRLTQVFPRCQFVATTHSPQIVAAVGPDQVILLTAAGVVRPDRTLGMDSNWILRFVMDADDRPANAAEAIQSIEGLIRKGNFKKARTAIAEAREKGLDLPDWSVLEARMARLEVLAR